MCVGCWSTHTHTLGRTRTCTRTRTRTFTRHWLAGLSLESWKAVGDCNTPLLLLPFCPTLCFQLTLGKFIQIVARCGDTCNAKFVKMYFTPGAPFFSVWNDEFGGLMLPSQQQQKRSVENGLGKQSSLMILDALPGMNPMLETLLGHSDTQIRVMRQRPTVFHSYNIAIPSCVFSVWNHAPLFTHMHGYAWLLECLCVIRQVWILKKKMETGTCAPWARADKRTVRRGCGRAEGVAVVVCIPINQPALLLHWVLTDPLTFAHNGSQLEPSLPKADKDLPRATLPASLIPIEYPNSTA